MLNLALCLCSKVAFKKAVKVLGEGLGEKRKKGGPPATAKHKVKTTRTAALAIPSLPGATDTLHSIDTGIPSAHVHHVSQQQQAFATPHDNIVRSNAETATSRVSVPATLRLPVHGMTGSPHSICIDASKGTHDALLTVQQRQLLMSQLNATGTRSSIDATAALAGTAITADAVPVRPNVSSSAQSRNTYTQQANEPASGTQIEGVLPIASALTSVFDSSSGSSEAASSRGNSPAGK